MGGLVRLGGGVAGVGGVAWWGGWVVGGLGGELVDIERRWKLAAANPTLANPTLANPSPPLSAGGIDSGLISTILGLKWHHLPLSAGGIESGCCDR